MASRLKWLRPDRLVLAFLILLAVAFVSVGDTTVWGEWLTIWPSLGWVPLLLPALLRYRNWAGTAALALVVGATTEWPSVVGTQVSGAQTGLRVVVWNVAGNAGFAEAIADLEPDLVLVQEATPPSQRWPGFEWRVGEDPAVLSRYPTRILPTASVGPWAKPLLLRVDVPGQAGILIANGRLMHPSVVTQMLDPMGEHPRLNHQRRVEQYPRLMTLIQESLRREGLSSAIVAGDFNTLATARSLDPLRVMLHDAWKEAGVGWGGTAPEFLPLARIDQCWLSADLTARRAEVLRRPGSDHRLLVVDLERR